MPIQRHLALLLASLALGVAGPARAEGPGLPADPALTRLIAESLAARPEIVGGEATVRAQAARVPQAGALPDPMLQLGVQHDGFERVEIGRMTTSYVSVTASQTFPWPGKRALRTELAALGVGQLALRLERLRLSTEAEVRRQYMSLQLARERLALLERQAGLWVAAARLAQALLETGRGTPAELLRAELEQSRIEQRRVSLQAEARAAILALDRLRGRPFDEDVETPSRLVDLPTPVPPPEPEAVADALARSPELAAARLALDATEREVALAEKDYSPDLVVSAGVMPRGGDFPLMWLLTVGGTLPVFAASKQDRAVEERTARVAASRAELAAVEQVLRLRVHERLNVLAAVGETLRVYRTGLLVRSAATAETALAQYRAGTGPFAAVLEANAGVLADEEAHLRTVAEAHRVAIAAFELSLEPLAGPGMTELAADRALSPPGAM